jgi:hypothetical protein
MKTHTSVYVSPVTAWLKRTTLFMAVAGTFVVSSCKKENGESLKPAHAPSDHRYIPMSGLASDVGIFEPNTMAWDDIVQGYSELDTRRRHAKVYLSIGITEVVKDPAIAAWITTEARKKEYNILYLEDLFDQFPETKAIVEAADDPLGMMTDWTFEEVQDHMQYGEYDIKASIYLSSLENVDNALKPIVTPGSDLYYDAEKDVDIVLGWHIDGNNVVSRINLWKEAARIAQAPVFVIDGWAGNIKDLINREGPLVTGPAIPLGDPNPNDYPPNSQPPDYATHRICISKYQIGHRYDNTSHSELEISGKMAYTPIYDYAATAWTRYFLREGGCFDDKVEEYELASVHKDDANNWTMINTDRFFAWLRSPVPADPNTGELDYNYVPDPNSPQGYSYQPRKILFFNTYENDDWPSPDRPISPEWIFGMYLGMEGKMENHDEWYQFDPTAGTHTWWYTYGMRLHISQMTTGWNYSLWTNPIKGMLQFKTTGYCNY